MNPQDAALDKIKRLLRLGRSANEHEARLALSKAAELARKHSIDLGCVNAEEERQRVAEKSFESRAAFDVVEAAAMQLCMGIFHVKAIYTATEATYIGLEPNAEAARWAHAFVVEQCGRDLEVFRRAWVRRRRRRLAKGAAHEYCMGWVYAVKHRYQGEIAEAEPQAQLENSQTAIILRAQEEEVAEHMKRHHSDAAKERKKRYREHPAAWLGGHADGKKVSIHRPLSEPAEDQLTLV